MESEIEKLEKAGNKVMVIKGYCNHHEANEVLFQQMARDLHLVKAAIYGNGRAGLRTRVTVLTTLMGIIGSVNVVLWFVVVHRLFIVGGV